MKKSIHRAVCVFFCLIVLCACLPASAFAVDPVSAGIMANAFAQAIAAYGASNGVAMTFDVANTNGIGESVHELWSQFRAGTQDADDYATLAAALFPDLYYKAANVVGAAADVYTVGYNISSTYAEEFDNFYNWLLSGPAEMTKIDNQYFQFSESQIGSNATPLDVYVRPVAGFPSQPLPVASNLPATGTPSSDVLRNYYNTGQCFPISYRTINNVQFVSAIFVDSPTVFAFYYTRTDNSKAIQVVSSVPDVDFTCRYFDFAVSGSGSTSTISNINHYHLSSEDANLPLSFGYWFQYGYTNSTLPEFASANDGRAALAGNVANPNVGDIVGLKAYGPTGIASFPDTTDPNYEAVAKRIPSDIPWDDTLFGDGTGTLTDAQSGSIAAEADQVLAEDGALTLAGDQTDNPGPDDDDDRPSSDPDDYLAVGLEDIFPFCIPFDIYNFLSALAAEPVAPHFTATLAFPPAIGGSQTIEIDFDSPTWNQLAQLLRLLELLAFIVGLALLTRSMFIRG